MKKQAIIDEIDKQRDNLIDVINALYQLMLDADEDEITTNNINDLDKFIRKLKEENLYTRELEEFIGNYIKYDNVEVD